jgi:tetratricopeptide (TPR) repeat protein
MYQVLYDFGQSKQFYRKAIELDGTSLDTRLRYAALLLDLQSTNEAIQQIREVLLRDPGNGLANTHLAHAYLLNEAYSLAEEHARKSVAKDHGDAQAHLWLAESLRMQRKVEEAKKNYERYLALSDFDSRVYEQVLFYALGGPFARRRATQKSVHRDHRAIAYLGLCQCEENLKLLNQAARHCGDALKYDKDSPNTYFSLGRINFKKYEETDSCDSLRRTRESFTKLLALNRDTDEAQTAQAALAAIASQKPHCR